MKCNYWCKSVKIKKRMSIKCNYWCKSQSMKCNNYWCMSQSMKCNYWCKSQSMKCNNYWCMSQSMKCNYWCKSHLSTSNRTRNSSVRIDSSHSHLQGNLCVHQTFVQHGRRVESQIAKSSESQQNLNKDLKYSELKWRIHITINGIFCELSLIQKDKHLMISDLCHLWNIIQLGHFFKVISNVNPFKAYMFI